MYESKISDAKWIAYDLPGNVGWIMFFVGLVLCFMKKPEMTGDKVIWMLLLLNLLCAAAMIVGIVELISERIQKLDCILPQKTIISWLWRSDIRRTCGNSDLPGVSGCHFDKGIV